MSKKFSSFALFLVVVAFCCCSSSALAADDINKIMKKMDEPNFKDIDMFFRLQLDVVVSRVNSYMTKVKNVFDTLEHMRHHKTHELAATGCDTIITNIMSKCGNMDALGSSTSSSSNCSDTSTSTQITQLCGSDCASFITSNAVALNACLGSSSSSSTSSSSTVSIDSMFNMICVKDPVTKALCYPTFMTANCKIGNWDQCSKMQDTTFASYCSVCGSMIMSTLPKITGTAMSANDSAIVNFARDLICTTDAGTYCYSDFFLLGPKCNNTVSKSVVFDLCCSQCAQLIKKKSVSYVLPQMKSLFSIFPSSSLPSNFSVSRAMDTFCAPSDGVNPSTSCNAMIQNDFVTYGNFKNNNCTYFNSILATTSSKSCCYSNFAALASVGAVNPNAIYNASFLCSLGLTPCYATETTSSAKFQMPAEWSKMNSKMDSYTKAVKADVQRALACEACVDSVTVARVSDKSIQSTVVLRSLKSAALATTLQNMATTTTAGASPAFMTSTADLIVTDSGVKFLQDGTTATTNAASLKHSSFSYLLSLLMTVAIAATTAGMF